MNFFNRIIEAFSGPSDPEQERLQAIKNSVCAIQSVKGEYVRSGHGVFILPDVVVTAWHVLRGGKDPVFINTAGQEAHIKSDGLKKFNAEIDIAIVELDRSLCKTPAIYGDTDEYLKDMKGTLATRFTGAATLHAAGLYEERAAFDYLGNNKGAMRNFKLDIKCGPGYSGSPVFDSRGRVCTLISQGQWDNPLDHANDASWSRNFAGPAPYRFASFIKQSLDI